MDQSRSAAMAKRSYEASDLDCWSIRDYRQAQPYHGRLSTPHPGTPYLRNDHMKHKGMRGSGGVIGVPGRIVATLQRKFWDSNKIVSDKAVWARDMLAGAYMVGREKAGEVAGATVHHTLQVYKFARDQSTTMKLPGPLRPVRDHLLIPSFRGVERSVEFLLSPRLGETYECLKQQGANLPLVGKAIFLPSVEAAEGATRFFLFVVQAPLPSAESVANIAEVSMDLGKRCLIVTFRELYFYMELLGQQMTRTMTRAQWDILGYGPYADLPRERRKEVVDRTCEKYLSLEHPIQRYEFLAHIRWHNAALYDDLVQTGMLRSRASAVAGIAPGYGGDIASSSQSPFDEDAWLDAGAVWRSTNSRKLGYLHGIVLEGVPEAGVGWFWRARGARESGSEDPSLEGGVSDEGGRTGGGQWRAFSYGERRRLERAFLAFGEASTSVSPKSSTDTSRASSTVRRAAGDPSMGPGTPEVGMHDTAVDAADLSVGLDGTAGVWEDPRTLEPEGGSLDSGRRMATKRTGSSVVYQPTADLVLDVRSYEVHQDDVLVEQGRYAVSIPEMLMRPVFWSTSGKGDEVCRAVWMQDTGSRSQLGTAGSPPEEDSGEGEAQELELEGLSPYSERAAAILEDAYQLWTYSGREQSPVGHYLFEMVQNQDPFGAVRRFLAWYLEDRGTDWARGAAPRREASASRTVLLTVPVADQLVQFRSLTDIVSIKRKLGGAFSVSGRRRVFRGIPVKKGIMGTGPNEARASVSTSPVTTPVSSTGVPAAANYTLRADGDPAVAAGSRSAPISTADTDADTGADVGAGMGAEESGPRFDDDLNEHVEHLVLVVHGIGDALMSVDLGVVQLGSLVECCDTMRAHHQEVMLNSKHLTGLCKEREAPGDVHRKSGVGKSERAGGDKGGGGGPGRRRGFGRVEYLPIEWHTRFKGRLYRESGACAGSEREEAGIEDRAGDCTDSSDSAVDGKHGNLAGRGVALASDDIGRSLDGESVAGGAPKFDVAPCQGGEERSSGSLEFGAHAASQGSGVVKAKRLMGSPCLAGVASPGERGTGERVGEGRSGLGIWDITLPRAPTLRAFTNDTLLDILYFMNPEYHQMIIEEVTQEINRVVGLFRRHTRSWSGKVSIVAHSLGAVICFDIMANQPGHAPDSWGPVRETESTALGDEGSGPCPSMPMPGRESTAGTVGPVRHGDEGEEGAMGAEPGRDEARALGLGGSLRYFQGSTVFPRLCTQVENVFCLGSPIGMFLMIRGQRRGLGKAFRLSGSRRLFNIFHPYDPVAFRLEPLLRDEGMGGVGQGSESRLGSLREPVILPTWTGGLRVHYQVQRWWQNVWNRVCDARRRAEASIESSLEAMGLLDESHHDGDPKVDILSVSTDRTRKGSVTEPEAALTSASGERLPVPMRLDTDPAEKQDGLLRPRRSSEKLPQSQPFGSGPPTFSLDSSTPSVCTPPHKQYAGSPAVGAGAGSEIDMARKEGYESHSCEADGRDPGSRVCLSEDGLDKEDRECIHSGESRSRGVEDKQARFGPRMSGSEAWDVGLTEEDLEQNGALAGGLRVDYCLQEKEFEVTNEYIFALGSHVLYWASKDVSLFIAQRILTESTSQDSGSSSSA